MKAKLISEGLRDKLNGPTKEQIKDEIYKNHKNIVDYIIKNFDKLIIKEDEKTMNFYNTDNKWILIYDKNTKSLYVAYKYIWSGLLILTDINKNNYNTQTLKNILKNVYEVSFNTDVDTVFISAL